jgi:transposase
MESQIQQLFRVALGLGEPWVVSKIEFSQEQHQLDLYLDFPAGSKFACPVCGRSGCGVYDTEPRTWRHLNFFQHKTVLHARQPRILCPDDGVKTVEVPWARPGVGFTLLMEAFIRGLTDEFPDAKLTFDNFHLMQLLTEAVDETRREEQRTHPELKGTRYVWLKNEWNHTEEQSKTFDQLRSSKLATARATHIKSVFQDLFACDSVADAEPLLKSWYFWATHSRIAPVIKAAKTIKEHWAGVLRWFVSRISNGVLEAINSLIQSAKAKARGFRNSRYLITMVYLIAGKLDFKLPTFAQATHTK